MFLGTFVWRKSRAWAPPNKLLYSVNDRRKKFIWLQHPFKKLIYLFSLFLIVLSSRNFLINTLTVLQFDLSLTVIKRSQRSWEDWSFLTLLASLLLICLHLQVPRLQTTINRLCSHLSHAPMPASASNVKQTFFQDRLFAFVILLRSQKIKYIRFWCTMHY